MSKGSAIIAVILLSFIPQYPDGGRQFVVIRLAIMSDHKWYYSTSSPMVMVSYVPFSIRRALTAVKHPYFSCKLQSIISRIEVQPPLYCLMKE